MTTPRIIPGDTPAYYANSNGLVLLGEFSRPITIDCEYCGYETSFKLIADEILTDSACDELLSEHLRSLGWDPDPHGDICPACTGRYA